MQYPQGTAPEFSPQGTAMPPTHAAIQAPSLLVPWSSPRRVFLENLVDCVLFREPEQPRISSPPAEFWPDVFVDQRLPWHKLVGSGLYHALAVAVVYAVSSAWVARPQVKPRSPFDGTKLTYYSVSEYLPEIDTGGRPAPKERKGEPVLAKQRIISLPPAPDNFHQTIITPDKIKITQDVPLPNIVANTTIPALPEAAMVHDVPRLSAPELTPIAPPPDVNAARSRIAALPAPEVVGPAVDPTSARARLNLPNVPGPEVIGPPPSPEAVHGNVRLNIPEPSVVGPAVGGDVHRAVGAINMAHADISVAAPRLPVVEQRAEMTIRSSAGSGGRGGAAGGGAQVQAPSLSSVTGAPRGGKNAGQLIALGIHPVAVNGPITVPRGSRSGEFAAGPEGKPSAPGTPDIHGGSNGSGGSGNGTNGAGHGDAAGPPGISVSGGPAPVPPGAVAAANPAPLPAPRRQPNLLASLGPTRVADIARNTRPVTALDSPAKPDEVFGTKKYYSMTLNMPSITSAGGSCIIRFAELNNQRAGGDLTAPIAMLKVDPAYPPEAIRERVEGTVTLYAVIHKDGSVGEVRVLHGVDERLDRNAQIALARWQFRPATRNGTAVDLEAVVQIPFIAKRSGF
jgi:TonB family protein